MPLRYRGQLHPEALDRRHRRVDVPIRHVALELDAVLDALVLVALGVVLVVDVADDRRQLSAAEVSGRRAEERRLCAAGRKAPAVQPGDVHLFRHRLGPARGVWRLVHRHVQIQMLVPHFGDGVRQLRIPRVGDALRRPEDDGESVRVAGVGEILPRHRRVERDCPFRLEVFGPRRELRVHRAVGDVAEAVHHVVHNRLPVYRHGHSPADFARTFHLVAHRPGGRRQGGEQRVVVASLRERVSYPRMLAVRQESGARVGDEVGLFALRAYLRPVVAGEVDCVRVRQPHRDGGSARVVHNRGDVLDGDLGYVHLFRPYRRLAGGVLRHFQNPQRLDVWDDAPVVDVRLRLYLVVAAPLVRHERACADGRGYEVVVAHRVVAVLAGDSEGGIPPKPAVQNRPSGAELAGQDVHLRGVLVHDVPSGAVSGGELLARVADGAGLERVVECESHVFRFQLAVAVVPHYAPADVERDAVEVGRERPASGDFRLEVLVVLRRDGSRLGELRAEQAFENLEIRPRSADRSVGVLFLQLNQRMQQRDADNQLAFGLHVHHAAGGLRRRGNRRRRGSHCSGGSRRGRRRGWSGGSRRRSGRGSRRRRSGRLLRLAGASDQRRRQRERRQRGERRLPNLFAHWDTPSQSIAASGFGNSLAPSVRIGRKPSAARPAQSVRNQSIQTRACVKPDFGI